MSLRPFLFAASLLALTGSLAGCDTPPNPDYRIKVVAAPSGQGVIAVPPRCPSWVKVENNPQSNLPWPQYGCADARNLAAAVVEPNDLIEGRDLGSPEAVTASAAIARYQAGKTTPLVDPTAKGPSVITKVEDSRVGGMAMK